MADRPARPWLIGLGMLTVATVGVGTSLVWWSADLQLQVDEYYRTLTGTDPISLETSDYWNGISGASFLLQSTASPFLAGGVVAGVTLLAVLARRWDRTVHG
ncbi:MAG: hypothetical protein ABI566_08480 [Pseudolysinimonas sp.]